MFSQEPRCRYHNNPLGEVICQLRFPQILAISANLPVEFQEAIRSHFPRYSVQTEPVPPKLIGTPGNFTIQNQPGIQNYQFLSEDGVWRVNLTSSFISLACTRYRSWEEFAGMLDHPLAAFIRIYKPAYFERVGLRYLNFFSRKALNLEETPYRELIHPRYLGILLDDSISESATNRTCVDAETAIRGGCRVKIHAGPGTVRQKGKPEGDPRFIFDQDLFMPGNIPVNLSVGALETLHSQAYSIFRGAITNTLHEAMEPEII